MKKRGNDGAFCRPSIWFYFVGAELQSFAATLLLWTLNWCQYVLRCCFVVPLWPICPILFKGDGECYQTWTEGRGGDGEIEQFVADGDCGSRKVNRKYHPSLHFSSRPHLPSIVFSIVYYVWCSLPVNNQDDDVGFLVRPRETISDQLSCRTSCSNKPSGNRIENM